MTKNERGEQEAIYCFTLSEWDKASRLADEKMKANNGHSYETILKTRCIYCGRSPRVKTKCRGWFMTLHNNLLRILMNKDKYL